MGTDLGGSAAEPTFVPAPSLDIVGGVPGRSPHGIRDRKRTELAAQSRDPLAVAFANASLVGAGYVMLGRRGLAAGTGLVTLLLLTALVSVARPVWFEAVVLLWWAALIVHGWYLAAGTRSGLRQGGVREQRFLAAGVTVPVLLAACLLRFDTSRIEWDVAEARRAGDCSAALSALDRRSVSHRVANAPLAARGDDTVRACELLLAATKDLDTALTGETEALRIGFGRLSTVLAQLPGHEEMAARVLDGFLDGLPTADTCRTQVITDWLSQRGVGGDVLDRVADVVAQVAPPAIVGCGDELMAVNDWQQARVRYERLLDQYPDHDLAAKAEQGVTRATQSIELANVRGLLDDSYAGSLPTYCTKPAPYSGAAPYKRKGLNRVLFFGPDLTWPHSDSYDYRSKLPAGWLARDAADAVLVICAAATSFGASVRTCPYESDIGLNGYEFVTFRKVAIPVRVYEVRTGRLVIDTKVEVGGTSCPAVLRYKTYFSYAGPPSEVYVSPTTATVRAAFKPLISK